MKPGQTILLLASTRRRACVLVRSPIATTRSPRMPRSAGTPAAPVPSTRVPSAISRSNVSVKLQSLLACSERAEDRIEVHGKLGCNLNPLAECRVWEEVRRVDIRPVVLLQFHEPVGQPHGPVAVLACAS